MDFTGKRWVLDGGVGHLLKESGIVMDNLPYEEQFVAGALANAERPQHVEDVHCQYLAAGVDVITTNSFAATPYALRSTHSPNKAWELIEAKHHR